MRIATWNVNGLRAATRKGLRDHVDRLRCQVLLLQEVRCPTADLPEGVADGFRAVWHPSSRAGYAGTAVWTRRPAKRAEGFQPDPDGRVLMMRVAGLTVGSIYVPSGSAGPEAQARKDAFCAAFLPWAAGLAASDAPVVLGGDFNVAPTAADIHDPRGNARNSGFLPHERAWFADLLATGWTDLVRAALGPGPGPWTWWSNRGRARVEDRGWRIDHLLGNAAAAARLRRAGVVRAGGLEVSDHAPVWVDLR
jgi:exodeoxyribonuclease-3